MKFFQTITTYVSRSISIAAVLLFMAGGAVHAQDTGQLLEVFNNLNQRNQQILNPLGGGLGPTSYRESIIFETNPHFPGPFDTTLITAVSYTHDLNRSELTWTIDGEVVETGIGKNRVYVQMKGVGDPTIVKLSGTTQSGAKFQHSRVIRPVHLAIAWDAHTYTPPFYKGKAMHSPSSVVTITAMPTFLDQNGKQIPPETMVYKWKQGTRIMPQKDGFNTQSITIKNEKFVQPLKIRVEVETKDGSQAAATNLVIPMTQPELVFYEKHPLYGILYNQAIGSQVDLIGGELTAIAEPYFFDGYNRSDVAFQRTWRIDRTEVPAGEEISLKPVGEVEGSSVVELTMRSTANILHSARKDFRVKFDGSAGQQQRSPEESAASPFSPQ